MYKYIPFDKNWCILILFSFLCMGCERTCEIPTDPSCANYDPCWEAQAASADFEMGVSYSMTRNMHSLQDTFVVSDTVLRGSRPVEFRGPEGYRRYQWKIGEDTSQFRDQNFVLFFTEPLGRIEIQLIVEKYPIKDCLLEEDLIDTVKKYLTVLPRSYATILGRYKGVLASQPQDSMEVWIEENPQYPGLHLYTLYNLNPGCIPTHAGASGELGYDVFLQKKFEYTQGECEGVTAWAFLDSSRRFIHIDYQTFYPESQDIFTGVKTR